MPQFNCIAIALLISVGTLANSSHSSEESPHLAEGFISLVQGRLLVRMPTGAKVEPRQFVTPKMPQDETQVVYEEGENKIVLRAQETFQIAEANYHEELEKTISEWGKESNITYSTRPLLKAGRFQATQIIPSRLDSTGELNLVRTAFALLPDNTVMMVSIFANPPAAQDATATVALAEDVLKSLTPGTRALDRTAGVRKLYIYSNKDVLSMSLPDGFVVTSDEGPDFLVHRCWKVKPFDQQSGSLGIYVGNMPSFHHLKRDKSSMTLVKIPGRLLGEKVTWFDARPRNVGSGKPTRLTEAIVTTQRPRKGFRFHVFFTSRDEEEFKEFLSIAQNLKIEPK